MQKFKAVIFDIDGTLANTVPLCVRAFRQAMEPQLHRPLTDEEIINAFGPDEEGTIQSFKAGDVKKATDDFMRYYKDLHDEMCPAPFNGIKDLLERLKISGVRLAVSTGKGKETSALSLQRFGIQHYFELVENGVPEGSRKPEAIRHILDVFGIKKEEVVYVGDSAGDIKESHKAGIPVVAAAWASTADKTQLTKEKPDNVFEWVQDFAEWLYEKI